MKVIKVQIVRFNKLVESYGRPSAKTLWIDPQNDPELKKAISQNRVLTVAQSNVGTKKDFGIIGFFQDKRGAFLIFPKNLGYAPGTKVIGIKWDLVVETVPVDPVNWRTAQKKSNNALRKMPKVRESEPVQSSESLPPHRPKVFEAVFHLTASQLITATVEADTIKEAKTKAKTVPLALDLSKAKIVQQLKRIKQQT